MNPTHLQIAIPCCDGVHTASHPGLFRHTGGIRQVEEARRLTTLHVGHLGPLVTRLDDTLD